MTWSDIPRDPSSTTLRQFAGLWLLCFGTMGGLRLPGVWGYALIGLALVGGVAGLVRPAWLRPVFVGWMMAVFPVGWVVSRVVLAGLFYGVFTPLALWFRWQGRDALRLRRPGVHSHWLPKPAASEVSRYYRQF